MKSILVGYNFTNEDNRAIEFAIMIAKKFMSRVWIIHIEDPDPDFAGYDIGPQSTRDQISVSISQHRSELQDITDEYREKYKNISCLTIQGIIADKLLEQIKKLDIELLVLGTHPNNFFDRIFNDGTLNSIKNNANCPILICN